MQEEDVLLELLSAALKGSHISKPFQNLDWENVYNLGRSQNIQALLYPALPPKVQGLTDVLHKSWQMDMAAAYARHEMMTNVLNDFLSLAAAAGIKIIVLKGMASCWLYSTPQLRTMGDIDVLIAEKDLEFVVNLLEKQGFLLQKQHEGEYVFLKAGNIRLEVHTSLFKLKNPAFRSFFADTVFDKSMPAAQLPGGYFLGAADNLLYMLAHMAKHLSSRGLGIRSLCDILLWLNHYTDEIDWNDFRSALAELHLNKLFDAVLYIGREVLHMPISVYPKENEKAQKNGRQLLEFMLRCGVHGVNYYILDAKKQIKAENNIINKSGRRARFFTERLFPSSGQLGTAYSYAKKHKVLLPVAWGHRIICTMCKTKNGLKEDLRDMDFALKIAPMAEQLCRDLDLFQ